MSVSVSDKVKKERLLLRENKGRENIEERQTKALSIIL